MSTPTDEREQPFPNFNPHGSSDDDTFIGDGSTRQNSDGEHHHDHYDHDHDHDHIGHQDHYVRYNEEPIQDPTHLTINTADMHAHSLGHDDRSTNHSIQSPSHSREQAHRLDDDLQVLQIEREVSRAEDEKDFSTTRSMHRSRSRHEEPVDEFDVATNPLHEQAAVYRPPEHPTTDFAKFCIKIHNSSWLVRYVTYISPVVLLLLIPLLIGALAFTSANVGGVKLVWFSIWLEIVWLTLWAGRLLAKCLPYPIGLASSLFTNNGKKWRDMGKELELPATLFFWWLAIIISFYPTMTNHHISGSHSIKHWEKVTYKILTSIFIGIVLNFVEKIIIQLIAISFHLRTYQDRIELNKFQIGSLVKLYTYSRQKITAEDSEFDAPPTGVQSGTRTPGQLVKEAQKNTKEALNKFGDVAGKIAGDFTGRQILKSNHPHMVVLTLLGSTSGSQVLARRLYRTFGREETETVHSDDLKNAFDNDDEADAAFAMFDKDMNGDISMEELEAVCVEIGRERKSITASLKDLDSVIGKLDDVMVFVVVVITILVFISLISTSAAGVLTSAGSSVLALSWLFSTTATEFLQSLIFVFVKHPFDVGDRVTVYGNAGSTGLGDDYFVKEIALLYTEFKKVEGHVVQAPNSYLNTLFILNQRRSGGLAEAVPICIKFGTTLEQIETLRSKLLEFVRSEKREYQGNILTELREITEAHSLTLNVVFFYKSNWQNELLRLQRRNKFICAMMVSMQEAGIEGPRMRFPGQKESFPVYLQSVPHIANPNMGHGGNPDNPSGITRDNTGGQDPPFVPEQDAPPSSSHSAARPARSGSILRNGPGGGTRRRGESLSAMGRRVDFSLGMKDISSGDLTGDVFEDRQRFRVPINITSPSHSRPSHSNERAGSHDTARSTARDSYELDRYPTDSSAARMRSNHRNRFFTRGRSAQNDVEVGMGAIPEGQRLDPRSGIVSPAAMRLNTGDSANPGSGLRARVEEEEEDEPRSFHAPRRSQTENFGVRR